MLYIAPPYPAVPDRIAYRLWTKGSVYKPGSGRFRPPLFAVHFPRARAYMAPAWLIYKE